MTKLGELKVGDAFRYNGLYYIAIALIPDPFEVLCLNAISKQLEELEEDTCVELIENWVPMEMVHFEATPIRGKDLEVLY